MTVKITEELRRALAASGEEPLRVIDPENNAVYVVLAAGEYDRITRAEEETLRASYPLQEAVARAEGWDDPTLDEYADYDAHQVDAALKASLDLK